MARTDPYVDLETFKAFVGIADDDRDDAVIEQKLRAASRQIDNWCGRFFGKSDEEPLAFTPLVWGGIEVDDLVSVSEVALADGIGAYGTVLGPTGYRLSPLGAAQRGQPYTAISLVSAVPLVEGGVRVTGVWGWPAVPDPIKEATALQANRLYKRAKAPFGVTGSQGGGAELGQVIAISSLDPDVKSILAPYRVMAV